MKQKAHGQEIAGSGEEEANRPARERMGRMGRTDEEQFAVIWDGHEDKRRRRRRRGRKRKTLKTLPGPATDRGAKAEDGDETLPHLF